jgi:hypothetical protein
MAKTTTHLPRGLRTLAAAAVTAGALALPLPSALASCNTAQSFAAYGDTNSYTLANNGSLEGPGGWTLSGGARIVSGGASSLNINVPGISRAQDQHSLLMPPGAVASTAASCIQFMQPPLRFAMLNSGTPGAKLQVSALGGDPAAPTFTPLGTLTAGPAWSVSSALSFLVPPGAIGFQFAAIGNGGGFQIDDVLVDPFKGR